MAVRRCIYLIGLALGGLTCQGPYPLQAAIVPADFCRGQDSVFVEKIEDEPQTTLPSWLDQLPIEENSPAKWSAHGLTELKSIYTDFVAMNAQFEFRSRADLQSAMQTFAEDYPPLRLRLKAWLARYSEARLWPDTTHSPEMARWQKHLSKMLNLWFPSLEELETLTKVPGIRKVRSHQDLRGMVRAESNIPHVKTVRIVEKNLNRYTQLLQNIAVGMHFEGFSHLTIAPRALLDALKSRYKSSSPMVSQLRSVERAFQRTSVPVLAFQRNMDSALIFVRVWGPSQQNRSSYELQLLLKLSHSVALLSALFPTDKVSGHLIVKLQRGVNQVEVERLIAESRLELKVIFVSE